MAVRKTRGPRPPQPPRDPGQACTPKRKRARDDGSPRASDPAAYREAPRARGRNAQRSKTPSQGPTRPVREQQHGISLARGRNLAKRRAGSKETISRGLGLPATVDQERNLRKAVRSYLSETHGWSKARARRFANASLDTIAGLFSIPGQHQAETIKRIVEALGQTPDWLFAHIVADQGCRLSDRHVALLHVLSLRQPETSWASLDHWPQTETPGQDATKPDAVAIFASGVEKALAEGAKHQDVIRLRDDLSEHYWQLVGAQASVLVEVPPTGEFAHERAVREEALSRSLEVSVPFPTHADVIERLREKPELRRLVRSREAPRGQERLPKGAEAENDDLIKGLGVGNAALIKALDRAQLVARHGFEQLAQVLREQGPYQAVQQAAFFSTRGFEPTADHEAILQAATAKQLAALVRERTALLTLMFGEAPPQVLAAYLAAPLATGAALRLIEKMGQRAQGADDRAALYRMVAAGRAKALAVIQQTPAFAYQPTDLERLDGRLQANPTYSDHPKLLAVVARTIAKGRSQPWINDRSFLDALTVLPERVVAGMDPASVLPPAAERVIADASDLLPLVEQGKGEAAVNGILKDFQEAGLAVKESQEADQSATAQWREGLRQLLELPDSQAEQILHAALHRQGLLGRLFAGLYATRWGWSPVASARLGEIVDASDRPPGPDLLRLSDGEHPDPAALASITPKLLERILIEQRGCISESQVRALDHATRIQQALGLLPDLLLPPTEASGRLLNIEDDGQLGGVRETLRRRVALLLEGSQDAGAKQIETLGRALVTGLMHHIDRGGYETGLRQAEAHRRDTVLAVISNWTDEDFAPDAAIWTHLEGKPFFMRALAPAASFADWSGDPIAGLRILGVPPRALEGLSFDALSGPEIFALLSRHVFVEGPFGFPCSERMRHELQRLTPDAWRRVLAGPRNAFELVAAYGSDTQLRRLLQGRDLESMRHNLRQAGELLAFLTPDGTSTDPWIAKVFWEIGHADLLGHLRVVKEVSMRRASEQFRELAELAYVILWSREGTPNERAAEFVRHVEVHINRSLGMLPGERGARGLLEKVVSHVTEQSAVRGSRWLEQILETLSGISMSQRARHKPWNRSLPSSSAEARDAVTAIAAGLADELARHRTLQDVEAMYKSLQKPRQQRVSPSEDDGG